MIFKTQKDISDAIINFGYDGEKQTDISRKLADEIAALSRSGVHFSADVVSNTDTIELGATKIGGSPDTSEDFEWPTRPANPSLTKLFREKANKSRNGLFSWLQPKKKSLEALEHEKRAEFFAKPYPLSFVAQYNLTELAKQGVLSDMPAMPSSGMLYIFYDTDEQPWGFDPKDRSGFQVVWYDGDLAALKRQKSKTALKSRSLKATKAMFPLDRIDDHPQLQNVDDAQAEIYDEAIAASCSTKASHRLGGHPDIVQNSMESECALASSGIFCGDSEAYNDPANAEILKSAKDWILLAQVSSDEDLGSIWGDLGELYVWIKQQDLVNRDFDKAWIILQCS